MPRKAKKKMHRMPPLSFLDKLIYWTIFLVLAVSYLVLLLGPLSLRNKIAFADTAVIAVHDHTSVLWLIVPWMTWFLMTFVLWYLPYERRKPIFGKRNFKYGPPAWPKEYPLFMKNKPCVFVSERKRKERKQLAVILLVVLLISFIPFPWSLYGRNCLYNDGSIAQYNMFNTQTREYAPEDISEVTFDVIRYRSGRHGPRHWGVRITLITEDGKRYPFGHRTFRDDEQGQIRYWLAAMLDMKACFHPAIIHYEDLEDLDLVVADKNMSQEEAKLLYQLFGQE